MSEVTKFLQNDRLTKKLTGVLGTEKAAKAFMSSALTVVNNNTLLQNADTKSIYNSLLMAATLNLPLNPSLGSAWIVPYKGQAQFQLGFKGYKQLAMRSGQFIRLNASDVREGELKSWNLLTGDIELESITDINARKQLPIVGYVSYFRLTNGFESFHYMTVEDIEEHALRYSQSYKKGGGVWQDDKHKMSLKTVSKLHLNRGEAPLSIEMEMAIASDSAVIHDVETLDVEYPDNQPQSMEDKQLEQDIAQALEAMENAKKPSDLDPLVEHLSRLGLQEKYDETIERLSNTDKDG